jgi:hypothetical protein
MALISKNNRNWASKGEKAKWFCVLPLKIVEGVYWTYDEVNTKDGYLINIIDPKEFRRIFEKLKEVDRFGILYVTNIESMDELESVINNSKLDYIENLVEKTNSIKKIDISEAKKYL